MRGEVTVETPAGRCVQVGQGWVMPAVAIRSVRLYLHRQETTRGISREVRLEVHAGEGAVAHVRGARVVQLAAAFGLSEEYERLLDEVEGRAR